MDPDTQSPRWDGNRLSASSFPRQGWSRLSPSYTPPTGDAAPSLHANWRPYNSAGDHSDRDRSHQPSTLYQVDSDPQPPSPRDRGASPVSGQPTTRPTYPVLVRAYSGNAEEANGRRSAMYSRRLFSSGLKGSVSSCPSGPPMPSDKDFSIASILQAIDPDIRTTLDSIAEICGRSKLSLANEYDSHIAPLGEIRAPPGGLVPVEEASSTDERRADEGIEIFEDEPDLMDTGRDMHLFSFHRYLENLRHTASTLERSGASASRATLVANDAQPASSSLQLDSATSMEQPAFTLTRELTSGPKQSGRDLLAKQDISDPANKQSPVATPALVSEIHLNARTGDQQMTSSSCQLNAGTPNPYDNEAWWNPEVVQSLLGWLRWTTRAVGPESRPVVQSAEDRLRAMLERPDRYRSYSPSP
ncbi:hypothetical protein N7462_003719 [Penicillium macrosclerotiorum]|uniref:uncharacterized protein n=1 Tax=Penicillium macrosclerotiorum TaxID=303699 RepID=UPI002548D9DE|nr:uncharacterized protein N7462_003719 [Penicillium macrosclerotiorum]KAJ5689327.1 hypothetical protein N7462_003719 [Penicillium macrosclerotiorum]